VFFKKENAVREYTFLDVIKIDHAEFRKRKKMLVQLSHNHEEYSFNAFKKPCLELGEYLTQELEKHILKLKTGSLSTHLP
jgi:hypothetical protein